jgi:hypothetical protein
MKKIKRDSVKKSPRTGNIGHFVYAAYSEALPGRAAFVGQHLFVLNSVFRELFSDENFRTLMRAESMAAIPRYLSPSLKKGKNHAMADGTARRR